jgi:hypothetical protein
MTTTTEMKQHPEKIEGKVTRQIEERTSRVPSGAYLGLAFGSMIASALFQLSGKKATANFIGQWVPSLLVIGLYNKLVKIEHELLDLYELRESGSFAGRTSPYAGETGSPYAGE